MPRPREPPVFFIDHCLGTEKVAERLRRAGVEARVMIEEGFLEDAEDASWLPVVAAKGWAVLTKDKRIRRRAIEHDAIVAQGLAPSSWLQVGLAEMRLPRPLPALSLA
jgi:hypothetical protein